MADTSAASLQALGLQGQQSQMALVEAVIRAACQQGATDISLREVQKALTRDHSVNLDLSSISGRVTALVAAKRVARAGEPRKCTVSGRDIRALSVPKTQGSLLL